MAAFITVSSGPVEGNFSVAAGGVVDVAALLVDGEGVFELLSCCCIDGCEGEVSSDDLLFVVLLGAVVELFISAVSGFSVFFGLSSVAVWLFLLVLSDIVVAVWLLVVA